VCVTGSPGAEERHGTHLCDEDTTQSGHAGEGTGVYNSDIFSQTHSVSPVLSQVCLGPGIKCLVT